MRNSNRNKDASTQGHDTTPTRLTCQNFIQPLVIQYRHNISAIRYMYHNYVRWESINSLWLTQDYYIQPVMLFSNKCSHMSFIVTKSLNRQSCAKSCQLNGRDSFYKVLEHKQKRLLMSFLTFGFTHNHVIQSAIYNSITSIRGQIQVLDKYYKYRNAIFLIS